MNDTRCLSIAAGLIGALSLAPVGPSAQASSLLQDEAAEVVERVEIARNQYLQRESLLFYVSTKPGDRYDEQRLKEDFRRLWNTGFLDDLILEVRDGARGKVVIFNVAERKRIQIVDYRGSKAVNTTAIEDELKKSDEGLRIDSFYDLAKARRVESRIRQMLAAKGHPFGTVKHEAKNIGGAGLQVSFIVDDGPRARVKVIDFAGNTLFSDGALRGRLEKIKQPGFWNLSWLGGKTTYTEERWSGGHEDPGDASRLQDFFLSRGYVNARVGEPKITYFDGKSGLFKKKPVKWMRLEIPIDEGDQYRVGKVDIDGLTVFKEDAVRGLFKLKAGDVYDESKVKKGYEKLRDLYGAQGYFQWAGATRRTPDGARKVVDVKLVMEEDRRYYVGRIHFVGNDSTRDKVIRREVYLSEGDVFNTEALKLSIRRINQLGFFKPIEGAPELQPSGKGDDKLDITFKVEEQNRNQFTFGGGVSGIEGAFLNASFQTANFLGRGKTLTFAAQAGGRTRNYQIAVTEPYFLDRPMTAGIDLFRRQITYVSSQNLLGYTQADTGLALTTGLPTSRFSRLFATYSYQIIDIFEVDRRALQTTGSTTLGSVPVLDPGALEVGRRYESRLTPSWVRNTTDNPFTPRSGTRYTASFQFVGGPLQGTVDYYRPSLEAVYYRPFGRKTALGVRGEVGYIHPFGATTEVPYYQRYFLGGENQIRGYDVRTVAPFDRETNKVLGGNKFVLFNAEYYFDVVGPLRFLLFFDAGEAYLEGQSVNWRTMRNSAGAELRFLMPILNVPFRLIYAYNANRDFYQPATVFKFAVGTTF